MTGHKVNIIKRLNDNYGIIWEHIENVKEEVTKQI